MGPRGGGGEGGGKGGRRRPWPWGPRGGPQYFNPAAAARGRGAEGGAAVLNPGRRRPWPWGRGGGAQYFNPGRRRPWPWGRGGGRSTSTPAAAARGRGAEGGAAVTTPITSKTRQIVTCPRVPLTYAPRSIHTILEFWQKAGRHESDKKKTLPDRLLTILVRFWVHGSDCLSFLFSSRNFARYARICKRAVVPRGHAWSICQPTRGHVTI